MNFWVLLQLLVNLILLAGLVGMWVRMNRPPKDDPRLSKGLQLLQSKIAVLEDLSDRTETQVAQLTALLEQKVKEIQTKIQSSEKQIAKIDQSMQKSLEVAKIFQDRIPHNEILERQSTIKYVKAARLAHQGLSVDEIIEQIPDLPRGEIEFIAKVNREQLMFCEESLPEWVQSEAVESAEEDTKNSDFSDVDDMSFMTPLQRDYKKDKREPDLSSAFEIPKADNDAMKKLGEAFKAACLEQEQAQDQNQKQTASKGLSNLTQNMTENFLGEPPAAPKKKTGKKNDGVIRPVEFRRIDMTKDLG